MNRIVRRLSISLSDPVSPTTGEGLASDVTLTFSGGSTMSTVMGGMLVTTSVSSIAALLSVGIVPTSSEVGASGVVDVEGAGAVVGVATGITGVTVVSTFTRKIGTVKDGMDSFTPDKSGISTNPGVVAGANVVVTGICVVVVDVLGKVIQNRVGGVDKIGLGPTAVTGSGDEPEANCGMKDVTTRPGDGVTCPLGPAEFKIDCTKPGFL